MNERLEMINDNDNESNPFIASIKKSNKEDNKPSEDSFREMKDIISSLASNE